jgi:hypothetical protein
MSQIYRGGRKSLAEARARRHETARSASLQPLDDSPPGSISMAARSDAVGTNADWRTLQAV